MVQAALDMMREGKWPYLGLEIGTRHIHIDNDELLFSLGLRPTIFAGISK
jgi:hypothetical protein